MTKALIPLAEGCEEMEAVIVVDTLRRAGWDVTTAGLEPGLVTASRGVMLQPDTTWNAVDPTDFDLLIMPGGGPGTARLKADVRVLETARVFAAAGKWLAAICAAPLVLHAAGVLEGRKATCYPGVEEGLDGVAWLDDRVVVDGHIVTSRGPGTAFEFALALIRLLEGETAARSVGEGMLVGD